MSRERAFEVRDHIDYIWDALTQDHGYLIVTKEGTIEGVLGNERHILLEKKEIEDGEFDKFEDRVKRLVEKVTGKKFG